MPFKSSLVAMFVLTLAIGCGRGSSSNVSSINEPTSASDTVEVSAKTDQPTSGDESTAAQDGKNATNQDSATSDAKKANNSDDKTSHQSHDNALSMPPKALADADATEMVRAWVVDQQLVCTLRPEIWEAPGTWGVLLADVAYQIANANAELRGIPAKDTLADIAASFNKEMPKQESSAATSNRQANSPDSDTSAKEATDTPDSDESAVSSKTNIPNKAAPETDTTDKPASDEKPEAERDK